MMLRKSSRKRSQRTAIHQSIASIEILENRVLLSVATINAGSTLRAVPSNFLGVNTAPWDGLLSSAQTLSLSQAAGIDSVRLGGGSYVDTWHFNVNNQSNTIGQQANYIANLNATGIVDVNYGTGSPQEAAAELAYLNGSVTNTATLGVGEQWNSGTNSWTQNVDWKTVGYWAGLRAAAPISGNPDGLNFLRIGHAAPFAFHYYEIGNEVYGSWETDDHGKTGDTLAMPSGTTRKAHDPTTIISFAKQFQTLAALIDPTITIGIDSQAVDSSFSNWISGILTQTASQGFTLGYIADHYYTSVGPGSENDATLLGTPNTSASGNTYDLSQRINAYDALIHTKLGSAGNSVQLLVDEFNSVSSNPGKESTSIVNGLFVADALGAALDTTGSNGLGGAQGVWLWDLHNGSLTGNNNSASLYGWRQFGDYGMLGSDTNATGAGSNEKYPDYFAMQLVSKFIKTSGGTVVSATEDNETNVDTYSILEANGHLELLVVNKTNPNSGTPPNNLPDPTLTEQFNISGFAASGSANIWDYGVAEDDAQANAAGGAASLTNFSTNLSMSNGSFSYALPDYSMMVFDLTPQTPPTVAQAAAANPTVVAAGGSTALTALGAENGSDSGLTYTWSATGPAGITYTGNSNGTNAAKSITANFTSAGNYNFLVTIADGNGLNVTSGVAVTVENFAVPSGSTLNINLGSAGPVSLNASGGTITASQNGVQISFTGMTSVTVTDTGSNDVLNFNGPISMPFSFVNAGTSIVNVNSGTMTFAAVPGGTISLGALSILNGATAAITPAMTSSPTTLSVGNLSIDSISTLDVANNEVLINYGSGTDPIASIAQWIATGYASGAWNGTGIISTIAQSNPNYGLGYADAADANNPANLPAGQIKILYTLLGDANLDSAVNGSDFAILSTNFNKSVSGWDQGDFNYDGAANGSDFAALSTNFNKGSNIAVAAVVTPPVEPPAIIVNSPVSAVSTAPVTQTVLSSTSSTADLKSSHSGRKAPRHGGHKA